jgi:hypothetical protein
MALFLFSEDSVASRLFIAKVIPTDRTPSEPPIGIDIQKQFPCGTAYLNLNKLLTLSKIIK